MQPSERPSQPSAAAKAMFGDDSDEPSGLAPAFEQARTTAADDFARKREEARLRQVEHARAQAEDEDALDAFMDAEVLPEVTQKKEEVCLPWTLCHGRPLILVPHEWPAIPHSQRAHAVLISTRSYGGKHAGSAA